MPGKIAVITFPSRNNRTEQTNFRAQAEQIISRNKKKFSSPLPSMLPIFSSEISGDIEQAFLQLNKANFANFEKIYLLAHGTAQGIKSPKNEHITINASELALKFMDSGGMRKAIQDELVLALRKQQGGYAYYTTCLRLLACNTGLQDKNNQTVYSTKSAKTYLSDFGNQIGNQIIETLNSLEKLYPLSYQKSNLEINIVLQAPTGWSVIMHSGETVVYHSDPAQEASADKKMNTAYSMYQTKAHMHADKNIAPFLKPDDQKKLTVNIGINKPAGSKKLALSR
ncbi:hypothetical protein BSQ98_19245 [Serratia liquefaciens]|uniref:hypothetical protein n=1 Tax=Serratia TaxID=613 RepID=UPI00101EAAB8|nr:hypothetical protein [Serratia liquefaciens]RYM60753.1 hypothetical protein BSQ98_19245 [Serratia liquefaciens]